MMGDFLYAENVGKHYMYDRVNRNGKAALLIYDAGRRGAVRSLIQQESALNVVADSPESSTRAVAHHVSVSHQTVCRRLNKNRLQLFYFQRVQTLSPADYLLKMPVNYTSMCTAGVLQISHDEQL
ncbi:hypothetical protein TNCV_4300461 [Trichonephila clavipes]|nr:hypothetical protein TNCV_4300461 [Trichonephila clavipes]